MTFYALAPRLTNERQRQQAVDDYGVASYRSPAVTELAKQAAELFQTSTSIATIIDRARMVVSGSFGFDPKEVSRDVSFCSHTIAQPQDATCVLDASKDIRFAGNPLVRGGPKIRFYIGVPLVSPCGHALGVLCVMDSAPRKTISDEQVRALRTLSDLVVAELLP